MPDDHNTPPFYPGLYALRAACAWTYAAAAGTAGLILLQPIPPVIAAGVAGFAAVALLGGVLCAYAAWWPGSPVGWAPWRRQLPIFAATSVATLLALGTFHLRDATTLLPWMNVYLGVWLTARTWLLWRARLARPRDRDVAWNLRPQLVRNFLLIFAMILLPILPDAGAYVGFATALIVMFVSSYVERTVWRRGALRYNREIGESGDD